MRKILALTLIALSELTSAALIQVDTNNIVPNDGVCDLADAINSANTDTAVDTCQQGSGTDTIVLSTNTAINFALPQITSEIIMLRGGTTPIIQASGSYFGRILDVSPTGILTLNQVSVRGGDSTGEGGCIRNAGILNITNESEVRNCIATGNGGGVHSSGTLRVSNSDFINNESSGEGGAIHVALFSSVPTFIDNEFINNTATNGGGVYFDATVNIQRTGFSGNFAAENGGAFFAASNLEMSRSSVTNNSSGIYLMNQANISNTTISSQTDYGIHFEPLQNIAQLALRNVTVKDNQGLGVNIPTAVGASVFQNVAFDNNSPNCFSADNTIGTNNISDDLSCPVSSFSNAQMLGPLTPAATTRFHFPFDGSSLIDQADINVCSSAFVNSIDQRGFVRPEAGGIACDVGAIENPNGTVFNNSIDLQKFGNFNDESNDGLAQPGETISYSFTVENTGDQALSNVTISDPLVAVPGSIASLASGAVDNSTFAVNYVVTQADIDAGEVNNVATVSGTDPSNATITDQSNNGVPLQTLLGGSASIDLQKFGVFNDESNDGVAQVGETISYTFTVTNTGNLTLTNVSINDPLAPVAGSLASMAPGAVDSGSFNASYAITQADINAGSVSNLATVTGTDPSNNSVTDQSNNGVALVTVLPGGAQIDLIKSGVFNDESNDGLAQPGETISYSFVVENTGNVTLTSVTINDPLVPVPGSVASMAPGSVDNSTFTATYVVTQADIDAGMVNNLATVTGFDPGNNPVTDQSNNGVPLQTALGQGADIELIKGGNFNDESNDGLAQPGETISYSFIVTNSGNVTLTSVTIDDPLTPVAGSVASMVPGSIDNATFTGSYAITQTDIDAGFVNNLATVTAQDPGNNPVSDQSNSGVQLQTLLGGSASINLQKFGAFNDENNDGFAQAGETISYTFTVENTGNLTLANVSINDPLAPVAGSLASMAPGAIDNGTFTATYTVTQADIDAGSVSNLATVTGTDPSNNLVTDQSNNGVPLVTDLPSDPRIDLTKAGTFNDENNDGQAQVGETISYTFVVTNNGNQTLTNVSINDPLAPVAGSVASMAPGAVDGGTFTASYTLVQADIDAGEVSNIATVTGSDPGNNPVTDQSNNGVALIINLPGDASIDLVKSGQFNDENNDGFAQVGETIGYSFEVINTGVQTLANISIDDPLAPVQGTLASLAAGASDTNTFTASYVLTQSDIDAAEVNNTATVTGFDPSNNAVTALSNNGLPLTIQLGPDNSIDLIKAGQFNDENNDGFAQVGETISYIFTVENTGTQTLTNVTIDDPLSPVAGSLASMAPGDLDTSTFSASYVVTQADIDAGFVDNMAEVSGLSPQNITVTDQSNDGVALRIGLPVVNGIALIKMGQFNDIDQDGFAQVGETITYTFTVMNIGDQTLSNITIDDPLVAVSGSRSSLEPGDEDSSTFSAVYTLTQSDIEARLVSNMATVTGFDPDSNPVTDQSNNGVPLITPLTVSGPTPVAVPVNSPLSLVILMMAFLLLFFRHLRNQ